jgi:hypothetical protein
MHIGILGFAMSLFLGAAPLPIPKDPIDIGNIHDQHISVMGLTNRPLHVIFADAGVVMNKPIPIISMIVFLIISFLGICFLDISLLSICL